VAVEVQDIESEEGERRCVAPLHRGGEVVEVCDAALVGRSDLAVEHDLSANSGQAGEGCTEVPAALIAVARQQPHATVAVGNDGEAVPIVLDLEEPAVARGRLARRGSELKSDGGRQRRRARALD
jgi:hypothetical protein